MSSSQQATLAQLAEQAAQLLRDGKYPEALETSEQAIALDANQAFLWTNKGIALRRLGRLDEAFEAYNKAIELNPSDADTWLNRGICVRAMNRMEMHQYADASYAKAVELDPKCVGAWQNLGNVSSRIGHFMVEDAAAKEEWFAKSREAYDRAIAIEPDNWEFYGNQAVTLIKQGKFREALEQDEKSLSLNPKYADAWYHRGYALAALERHEEALEALEKVVAILPDDDGLGVRARINIGNALLALGRPDEALQAYDDAIAVEPRDFEEARAECRADAWYNKALVFSRQGKDKESSEAYERSLELRKEAELFRDPIKQFVGPAATMSEHIKNGL